MKNKGFLNRSRIGDNTGHKDIPETEIRSPGPIPTLPDKAEVEPASPPPIAPTVRSASPHKARRYTLALRITTEAADHLNNHLARFHASRRPILRRAIITAFLADLEHLRDQPSLPEVTGTVRLRIDLRLTDDRRDQLLALANRGRFEPIATALARLLSGRLSDFLRQGL
jgi:hypothetical protein